MFTRWWDRWRLDAARSQARLYAVAIGILAASLMVKVALNVVLPGRLPFITFFPAVLLTAYLCGTVPSVLVLLATALAGAFWLDPPGGMPQLERVLSFVLFLFVASIQIVLIAFINRAISEIKQQERMLGLINRELKHRLKNILAVVNSVFMQSVKAGYDSNDLRTTVSGRVQAIAAAQDLLSATATDGSPVGSLVEAVVRPLAPDENRLRVSGADIALSAEQTTPFALLLHELATNATKHGAWRHDAGIVSIAWQVEPGGTLMLEWRERDGAPVVAGSRTGLGAMLIKQGVPGARVRHDLKPDGLDCRIELPL